MNEKEFLSLCKEFITAQRKQEKKDKYVNNSDFDVLYRFICKDGWKRLAIYRGEL